MSKDGVMVLTDQICRSEAPMPIKICWFLVVFFFPFVGICAWACCGPYETG